MDLPAIAAPTGPLEPVKASPLGSELTTADDLVGERFRQVMGGATDAASPVPLAPTAGPGHGPEQPASLGDAVLAGMNKMSSDFQQAWSEVNASLSLDMDSLSAATMLKLQWQIHEVSTVMDVTTKGVSKVIQDIEQLTKIQ